MFPSEFQFISFTVFELLKQGEILQIPTENPMAEKQAWSAFRDIIHGLEYRKNYFVYITDVKTLASEGS